MLKIVVTAAVIGLLPAIASATPCPSVGCGGPHRAPAPLLAAGIPAFIALGGGAAVARLLRRRRDPAAAHTQALTD
jgi:hypothetical protein